jgi:hypothetical protein
MPNTTKTKKKPLKSVKSSSKRAVSRSTKKTPLLLRPLKRLRSRGSVKLPNKRQTKKLKKLTTKKWFMPALYAVMFGVIGCYLVVFSLAATDTASCTGPCKSIAGAANASDKYWIMGQDGGVFSVNVPYYGSVPGTGAKLSNAVGMVSTPNQAGYYIFTTTGAVYAFGNATYRGGSPAGVNNVVGFALRPQGDGYWMAGADGGIFAYGAPYKGNSHQIDPAKPAGGANSFVPNKPIVGIASTKSGNGYWMVGADGGIYSFGDAPYLGSLGSVALNSPIVAIEPSVTGNGYWLVAADGGIFAYGDAAFYGSLANVHLVGPIVSMERTPSGKGYWMLGSDGGVFAFGDAKYAGRVTSTPVPPPAPPKPPAPNPTAPKPSSGSSSSSSSRSSSSGSRSSSSSRSSSGSRSSPSSSSSQRGGSAPALTADQLCERSAVCRREVRDSAAAEAAARCQRSAVCRREVMDERKQPVCNYEWQYQYTNSRGVRIGITVRVCR